jgi:hypothetical protein
MSTWETVIGHGRERELLDTVMRVVLDRDVPSLTFEWLCDYIAECWGEGHLAHAGFTPDDLAGLSWRLGRLAPEQREEILAAYLRY